MRRSTAQRALELPVRMGLATGEAELRDGDYFGTVLNRAARVMAAGHGGQILVDDVDSGSAQRRRPDCLGATAITGHRQTGRGEPGPGAGPAHASFRRLRTLDATPGNLRPHTTSLIGRDSEVAEVQAALKAHRLVTLTGVGGVGKTRLAVEVAARLADEFPTGSGFSNWRRSLIRRRYPTRWPRCWASPNSQARP